MNMKTSILAKFLPVFAPEDGTGGGAPSGSEGGGGDTAPASSTVLGGDAPKVEAGAGSEGTNAADSMYGGDKSGQDQKTAEEKAAADAAAAEAKKAEEAKAKEGKDGKDAKPDAVTLESINLDVPEGFELDAEVGDEFKAFAVEQGYTQEQVDALKGMQVKLYEKQSSAHAEVVKGWGEQLKTHKEIGGAKYEENIGYATAAVNDFFSPEAKRMLDVTGLGNHPDIVAGFARLGRSMGEGRTHSGKAGQSSTSIVDAMYPEG